MTLGFTRDSALSWLKVQVLFFLWLFILRHLSSSFAPLVITSASRGRLLTVKYILLIWIMISCFHRTHTQNWRCEVNQHHVSSDWPLSEPDHQLWDRRTASWPQSLTGPQEPQVLWVAVSLWWCDELVRCLWMCSTKAQCELMWSGWISSSVGTLSPVYSKICVMSAYIVFLFKGQS